MVLTRTKLAVTKAFVITDFSNQIQWWTHFKLRRKCKVKHFMCFKPDAYIALPVLPVRCAENRGFCKEPGKSSSEGASYF